MPDMRLKTCLTGAALAVKNAMALVENPSSDAEAAIKVS